MSLQDFPRHPVLFGPRPVHPLDRLTEHLGGARIWAKREDCNSGLAYGGNKTRKLEYLSPTSTSRARTLSSRSAAYQSNHTRQVATLAAKLGLRAVLVQSAGSTGRTRSTTGSATSCCREPWAPRCGLTTSGFGIGFKHSWNQALEDVRERGGTPYGIPAGASDHELGGLGFANWAYEVEQQEQKLGVFFDTIVVCSVTGSTHAGMIAGFASQDRPRRVIGIDASAKITETRDQVARIARSTAELIDLGRELGMTRSPCSRDGLVTTTASPCSRRSTRSASPGPWRA